MTISFIVLAINKESHMSETKQKIHYANVFIGYMVILKQRAVCDELWVTVDIHNRKPKNRFKWMDIKGFLIGTVG